MAQMTREQLEQQMSQKKGTPAPANAPAVETEKPKEAAAGVVTSEFTEKNVDPTMPVKLEGRVSRAEKALRKETVTLDGKEVVIEYYRVYEKDGTLHEVPYNSFDGKELTKEGKEAIKAFNREEIARNQAYMANLHRDNAPKIKLQEFLRKFGCQVGVVTPNNVQPELSVGLAPVDKNGNIEQKRYRSNIREKSPGGVKQVHLFVPIDCWNALTENAAIDMEMAKAITEVATPAMRVVAVSKDDYPKIMLSVIGGPLRVNPHLYDPNTSKYATLSDIPSINGLPAGEEVIYFTIDESKIALSNKPLVPKPGEDDKAFAARMASYTAKQEKGSRYRSGGMSLDEKATIIKIRDNTRSSLISPRNYIPMRTFGLQPIGRKLDAIAARTMNAMYLRKLESDGIISDTAEAAKVDNVDGKITSSIYFPATDAHTQADKPTIKKFFRTRKKDGTTEKISYVPKEVIAKKEVVTEKGDKRIVNVSFTAGEAGYEAMHYDLVKNSFQSYINSLPEAMRCPYLTLEEIVAANKKTRSSTVTTKISSTGIDQSLLDVNQLMADLALGDGSANIAVATAKQNIDAIKATRSATVQKKSRFDDSKLKQRLAPQA